MKLTFKYDRQIAKAIFLNTIALLTIAANNKPFLFHFKSLLRLLNLSLTYLTVIKLFVNKNVSLDSVVRSMKDYFQQSIYLNFDHLFLKGYEMKCSLL
jgi:hypothetical protein